MARDYNILLADDHALVRGGIRGLLERLPGIKVLAEVSDGRAAVTYVQLKAPDMVVMDVSMPGLNGLDATATITSDHPEVKVLVLSMHASEDYVLKALAAGAKGYLLKDAATDELGTAIDAIRRGETYLSSTLPKNLLTRHLDQLANPRFEVVKALTPRMREILQLIAEGKSSKEIAYLLNLSIKTIETHRMHMMARLDIHDVAGLVRYAMRHGMISPEN
ncbi:MAG: response regulator transcription factor [Verrucomicrobia bacterium]|nr:response regulator transcription factor [Verrucomicrobiota bacterium]